MPKKIYSYQNFDFDVNNGSLDVLLWSIYAGIVIGVLSSLIYRVSTHSFVSAVIKAGALNEQSAVTLDSLDFRGKWYIKRQLRAGNSFSRLFVCPNADTFPKKKRSAIGRFFLGNEDVPVIPFETAKFYLPEGWTYEGNPNFACSRRIYRQGWVNEYTITVGEKVNYKVRGVLELSIEGRAEVDLIPLIFFGA
jgi:hypothetical protein